MNGLWFPQVTSRLIFQIISYLQVYNYLNKICRNVTTRFAKTVNFIYIQQYNLHHNIQLRYKTVAALVLSPGGGRYILICIDVYLYKFSRSNAGATTTPNIFKGHYFFFYVYRFKYPSKQNY